MRSKRFTNIPVLIFLFCCILQPITASSNPLFAGNTETRLLEIQESDNADLLETLLMVSKHWQPSLNLAPLREEIQKLVHSARKKLQESGSPGAEKLIRAIRTVIHDEGGYRYTDQVDERGVPTDPEELFLHGLLRTHKGYCMNLSLLYLILAQKLELPLYGVALPNHFFVRYELKSVKINIETTEQGISYPDSFYLQRFGTLAKSKNSYFMKNLGARQTLGAYFSNVAMVYYRNQKPERAVFYLGISTAINPQSIDAQNNLANIYSL